MFVPYILDQIPLTMDTLNQRLSEMGLVASSQNSALTVCAVAQADPVRVLHVQTEPASNDMLRVTTLRYIV